MTVSAVSYDVTISKLNLRNIKSVRSFFDLRVHVLLSVTAASLPPSDAYPPMLTPFQILPRSSGVWFHSFEHLQTHYLVYLTSELSSPLTTRLGSLGTFPSLTPGVHSTIYQWEGVYTAVQVIIVVSTIS